MKILSKTIIVMICSIGISISGELSSSLGDSLVAYYPFNGGANDLTELGNHGIIYGASPAIDRNQIPASAYNFDGIDDYMSLGTIRV